ncbi:cytochrome P450 [Rhodococcus spelaei]|uniref:Cytochrome P450 n=1 Tax=Rhodococcus spelaei TaxID=2546320 RepID=A0A541B9R8_9NOCA|nr:cytochrome P450 [Rhodococcus spelaei]TQF69076.1 cytochrome P450 [Rhodococcus spelaei]
MDQRTAPPHPRPVALHAAVGALDLDRYLRWRRDRDGDPFRLAIPSFGETLFTGTADGAEELFRLSPGLSTPPLPNPIDPLVGANSLILLAGDRHRRERRLMLPALHGNRMREYGQIAVDAAREEMNGWVPGVPIRVRECARAVTLTVIVRAVFGVTDRTRRDEYARVVTGFLASYGLPLVLAPALRRPLRGRGLWSRFVAQRSRFDALLAEEVRGRRERGGTGGDILTMLMDARYEDGTGIDSADLVEELRTLLVAGHETTATSVTWALCHLHREPRVRARLLAELDAARPDPAPGDLAALPYLGAVCQEVLRLHPAVPVVLRRMTGPAVLRGVRLDAGDTAGVALGLLHSDTSVFPDPGRFDPDRFLGRHHSPYEYAPFGGGHRRCVGAAFAEYEMRIVLGTIMSEARLRMPDRDRRRPPPVAVPHDIATGPRRPVVLDYLGPR